MYQKLFIFLLLCLLHEITADYVRGCYLSNQAHYRRGKARFEPEMYIPRTCTHIFYAFAKINENFTAAAEHDDEISEGPNGGYYARVNKLKDQQPGLKTILSFGGANAGTENFKKLAANEGYRKIFVNSAMQFIDKYGFDGIDIDWEFPEADDYENYVSLLKDLKQANSTNLLTAAVPAKPQYIDQRYNVKEMAKYLDYANVMTYDFHGSWENKTGENSPLYSSDVYNTAYAMNYWAQKGMPKEKLLLGIATYGIGWKLNDPNSFGMNASGISVSTKAYFGICNIGGKRYWNETQKVPYRVSGNLWYGYDDSISVTLKMKWLKTNGFGGAFTWTLDMDDFSGKCPEGQKYILHNAIKKILG